MEPAAVDSLNELGLQSTPMTSVGASSVSNATNTSSAQAMAAGELPSFQYFISEQAKSMLALQELQNEVGALLEFRDLVMEAFPQLGQKVQNLQLQNAASLAAAKWEPGIRVKRKLGQQLRGEASAEMLVPSLLPRLRANSKGSRQMSGSTTSSSAVQDSGFCTESSKDHLSVLSGRSKSRDAADELLSLLDNIHGKGSRLKLEVEYLCGRLSRKGTPGGAGRRRSRSLDDASGQPWEAALKTALLETELEALKGEREALARKLESVEGERLANAAQTGRLLAELEATAAEKRRLEERLGDDRAANFLVRDQWRHVRTPFAKCQLLQLEQVFKAGAEPTGCANPADAGAAHAMCAPPAEECSRARLRPANPVTKELNDRLEKTSAVTLTSTKEFGDTIDFKGASLGKPDVLIGYLSGHTSFDSATKRPGVTLSKEKVLSILNEYDPKTLHCLLLTLSYQVEALNVHMQRICKSRMGIFKQLNKYKFENEDLKLELKKKEIELEGTKAQKRVLEQKCSNEVKYSYSTSDLMMPKSCALPESRGTEPAYACSISDSALLDHRTSTPSALGSGAKCTNFSRGDANDRSGKGNANRRSYSKIPLKTYSNRIPNKLNSGSKKSLTSFKEYSTTGLPHSSCISSTSSSLNHK